MEKWGDIGMRAERELHERDNPDNPKTPSFSPSTLKSIDTTLVTIVETMVSSPKEPRFVPDIASFNPYQSLSDQQHPPENSSKSSISWDSFKVQEGMKKAAGLYAVQQMRSIGATPYREGETGFRREVEGTWMGLLYNLARKNALARDLNTSAGAAIFQKSYE